MTAPTDRSRASVDIALNIYDRTPSEGFQPLHHFKQFEDGASVELESRRWHKRFLRPAANPYEHRAGVKRSYWPHTANTVDVIRHEYVAGGLPLVVLETNVDFVVVVNRPVNDLLTLPEREAFARIDELAERLLAMEGTYRSMETMSLVPYRWAFQYPPGIGEAWRFSTNFNANALRMWSWAYRMDGGIRNERLYFMGFKKYEETDGKMIMLSPQDWFSGDCWKPYRDRPFRSPPSE